MAREGNILAVKHQTLDANRMTGMRHKSILIHHKQYQGRQSVQEEIA